MDLGDIQRGGVLQGEGYWLQVIDGLEIHVKPADLCGGGVKRELNVT